MAEPTEPDDLRQHPAVRNYTLVCVVSLLAMVVTLLAADVGPLSLLPVMLGSLALVAYWRAGPAMVLGCLAILLLIRANGRDPTMVLVGFLYGRAGFGSPAGRPAPQGFDTVLMNGLLAAAMLAYTAGFFRLYAIVKEGFPKETRKGKKSPRGLVLRDPELVTGREIGDLVLSVPMWTLLAGLLLWWVTHPPTLGLPLSGPATRDPLQPRVLTPFGMPPGLWQVIVLVLVGGVLLAASAYLLGYVGMRRARREEAELYMQDQLWRETRHEQARINRWLTWRRIRGQRREEKS